MGEFGQMLRGSYWLNMLSTFGKVFFGGVEILGGFRGGVDVVVVVVVVVVVGWLLIKVGVERGLDGL